MATTFAGFTIQSDSFGVYFGDCEFAEGDVEQEMFEFGIPRASGVGEKTAGDRRAIHTCRITWKSTDEEQVRDKIRQFRQDYTVGSLVVESATSTNLTFQYCRLMDVRWGRRAAGYTPQGTEVSIFDAVLIFKQVRVA